MFISIFEGYTLHIINRFMNYNDRFMMITVYIFLNVIELEIIYI